MPPPAKGAGGFAAMEAQLSRQPSKNFHSKPSCVGDPLAKKNSELAGPTGTMPPGKDKSMMGDMKSMVPCPSSSPDGSDKSKDSKKGDSSEEEKKKSDSGEEQKGVLAVGEKDSSDEEDKKKKPAPPPKKVVKKGGGNGDAGKAGTAKKSEKNDKKDKKDVKDKAKG